MASLEQLFNDYDANVGIEVPNVPSLRRLRGSVRVSRFVRRLDNHANNLGTRTISAPLRFFDRATHKSSGGGGASLGDKYLNGILQTLTEFSNGTETFALRDEQMGIVAHMLAALLPFLYKENLETNKKRLLEKLMIESIKEQVFILAGRRAGKTTAMGAFFAAVMIVVPKVTIVVIANVWRNAKRIKDAATMFLLMHPKGRQMFARKPGFPIPTNNKENLKLYGETDCDVKELITFPEKANGRMASSIISAGAMNLDWTNRKISVRSSHSLEYHVKASLERLDSPDLFGFCEVASKQWVKRFERSTRYGGTLIGGSYERDGYFYVIWNRETLEFMYTVGCGDRNRFVAAYFYHAQTDTTVLFITVHMPREKEAWWKEADSIAEMVSCREHRQALIIIAGDFNADPMRVSAAFGSLGFHCAIHTTPFLPTTAAGNSIDNVLSNRGFTEPRLLMDDKYGHFSHYAIASSVSIGAPARATSPSPPSRGTLTTAADEPEPPPGLIFWQWSCTLLELVAGAAALRGCALFFR